jgi:probable rRNA maturation factor
MKISIIIQNHQQFPNAPKEEQFQTWVDAVFEHIDNHIPTHVNELCIRIVDSKESAELNKAFRKKSGPTNVLAFPNEQVPETPDESLGDIAICADLVASEAVDREVTVQDHWAHLTIHATLHLLGYDHMEKQDAIIMEDLEIKILQDLNINNPYESDTE